MKRYRKPDIEFREFALFHADILCNDGSVVVGNVSDMEFGDEDEFIWPGN